jgi:hypothetical protein
LYIWDNNAELAEVMRSLEAWSVYCAARGSCQLGSYGEGEEDMESMMSGRMVHVLNVLMQGSVITAGLVTMGKDTRTKRSLASAFLRLQSI